MKIALALILLSQAIVSARAVNAVEVAHWPEVRRSPVTRVDVADGRAYVASAELLIVDVSNPSAPTLLGHVGVGSAVVGDVEVRGNYAYVSAANGLHIVDISAPANPRVVGRYFVEDGLGSRISLEGTRAYVADGRAGARIYDIANPESPTLIGTIFWPGVTATAVVARGNIAYVGNDPYGVRIYDVTNPAAPVFIAVQVTPLVKGLTIDGNHLFVAANTAGVYLYDISTPTAPVFLSSIENERYALEVRVVGNLAAFADQGGGAVMVDYTNPSAPVRVGAYEPTGDLTSSTRGVAFIGNIVYAADARGLEILDVSNLASAALLGRYVPPSGRSAAIAIGNNVAYVFESTGELFALNISEPSNPTLIGTYTPGGRPILVGNHLFIGRSSGGFEILDVSDPANMRRVGEWNATGNLVVDGTFGFLGTGATVEVYDLTDPLSRQLIGTYAGAVSDVEVSSNFAYVAGVRGGLDVISLVGSSAPERVGHGQMAWFAAEVEVEGNIAYVLDSWEFVIFDVSNPTAPQRLSVLAFETGLHSMEAVGDRVLITTGQQIVAIDASDPRRPRIVGDVRVFPRGPASDLKYAAGLIYTHVNEFTIYEPGLLAAPVLNVRLEASPTFWLSGLVGQNYIVEHAGSLDGQWTALPAVTLATSPQAITVPTEARFVRARLAP